MSTGYISYLILNDYLTTIRSDQLSNQLLDAVEEGGLIERQAAEAFAINEVRSILGSYFYLDFEFRDLIGFIYNRKYYAGDRCIIDFDTWIGSPVQASNGINNEDGEGIGGDEITGIKTYEIGDCVLYNGGLNYSGGIYTGNFQYGSQWVGYCCKKENSDSAFVAANWIAIGNQYDIYNVGFPYDVFQLKPTPQIGIKTPGLYRANISRVCWDKKLWLCINDSIIPGHHYKEQFYQINDIPAPNIFPNQPPQGSYFSGSANSNFQTQNQEAVTPYNEGNQQWCCKGEYYLKSVTPFQYKWVDEDLNKGVDAWTAQYRKQWCVGDNRDSTMKEIVIAIAISHLLGRNSFGLKERSIKRDWAYRKLNEIRTGGVTTLIPILQPDQVGDISHGGSPKIINTF